MTTACIKLSTTKATRILIQLIYSSSFSTRRVGEYNKVHWRTDASSWEQQDIRSTVPCTGDKEYRKIRQSGGYFSTIKIVIIHSVWHVRSVVLSVHSVRSTKWWHTTPFYLLFSELNHIDHDGLVLVDGVPQSTFCKWTIKQCKIDTRPSSR